MKIKENQVELLLFNWFKSNNIKSWFNRKVENYPFFRTKNLQKKIDMIILSKNFGFIGLEIKNGEVAKNIYDGTKIIDYMNGFVNKEIIYLIDDKPIDLSIFCVATQFSQIGRLFKEKEKNFPEDKRWHKILQKVKNEPPYEYCKSHQFIRQLWGQWRRSRTYKDKGIGILLSSYLDDKSNVPKIFFQIKELSYRTNKERWNVKWQKI